MCIEVCVSKYVTLDSKNITVTLDYETITVTLDYETIIVTLDNEKITMTLHFFMNCSRFLTVIEIAIISQYILQLLILIIIPLPPWLVATYKT